MNYLILETVTPSGACRLASIKNVPRDERLKLGVSCSGGFPEDALFKMSDDFPKDVRLTDSAKNISSLLVVSGRLKAALEGIPGALVQNEVLPIKILNHKGRAEKVPYFIIHQLNHPTCLDEKRSKGTKSTLNPKRFQFMEKMVLDEKEIPRDLMLFRPSQYPRYPLVRRDLAENLGKLGLTGVEFREIASYEF